MSSKIWRNGDFCKYGGSYTGTIRLEYCKVFDDTDQNNVGIEDPTGTTWFVPGSDLREIAKREVEKPSRVDDIVKLKSAGMTVDEMLRLFQAGVL